MVAGETSVVTTSGCHGCGGRCLFKVHVRDGVIVRVETDDAEEPQLRACLRGRATKQRIYAPDRLKYPLRRVGERGEGKFERISWDEALDTVAGQMQRIKSTCGSAALALVYIGGSPGRLHHPVAVERLLNKFGGFTSTWGDVSAAALRYACNMTYGTVNTANTREDLFNSRFIILWGWDPVTSVFIPYTSWYLAQAREKGARIVCIDPRYTNSAATLASQWIPIRPGTDAAMLIAMTYVTIKEDLCDQDFLTRCTIGFDKYKDYILGKEDGIPRTPEWAEPITGVSATAIIALAREYATVRPAALMFSFAPGRTAYGEQCHRAAIALAAMTGNTGVHGGNSPGYSRGLFGFELDHLMPVGANPLEPEYSRHRDPKVTYPGHPGVHRCKLWDAILKGKKGGYASDIKLLYVTGSNPLNQLPNINKGVAALKKLEFIVVHEQFMTATARFADIVLPLSSHWERNDLTRQWSANPYIIYCHQAIEPLYESKSDFEICVELARRLGIKDYSDKTEEEWLGDILKRFPGSPDYDALKKKGIYRIKFPGPFVSFREQVEDPQHHPFPTPSGKIEIYSQAMADLNDPKLPPIPRYIEAWESRNDALAGKYPLQLITTHPRATSHSTFGNVPWLRELSPQEMWINSVDAAARGISDGNTARVFNGRGELLITARVTERIMPGVVNIPEGAWYDPGPRGVDSGGCANVLTRDEHTPGGGLPGNTCLVQVQKV